MQNQKVFIYSLISIWGGRGRELSCIVSCMQLKVSCASQSWPEQEFGGDREVAKDQVLGLMQPYLSKAEVSVAEHFSRA